MEGRARLGLALALCTLLVGSLLTSGCDEEPVSAPHVAVSFFALGDTGASRGEGQLRVAEALTWRDSQRPADGLILLGDNFYPRGLERADMVERVIRNVISPYCGFVRTSPSLLPPGKWDCGGGPPGREVWAVLGNHDHDTPESAELQRTEVAKLVTNWRMPRSEVETIPLKQGVDLILVDSVELIQSGHFDALRDALRASPGPWRILVGHYPFLADWSDPTIRSGMEGIRHAVQESAVPVHLALGGHEHNLQIVAPPAPGPALQVIAGGGSNARPVKEHHAGRLYEAESTGFARVDLVEGEEAYLRVQIFEVPEESWPWVGPAPRTACFRVHMGGDVDGRCTAFADS